MKRNIQHWLAAALGPSGFYGRYPGYVHVLAALEAVDDPAVPVMAVSCGGGRLRLHVNRSYFEAQPRFLTGVLLHEIHHVVLGHLTRPDLREVVFPDLMALAMETSANEYIAEPLPGSPCQWQDYQGLGLAAHQSTRERYDLLVQGRREGKLPSPLWQPVDAHSFLTEPAEADGPAARLLQVLARLAADSAQWPDHGTPRIAGRTPGELLETLRGHPLAPTEPLDWRREMAAFPQRLRGRQRAYSYARPNRRFPERLGEVPSRLRRPDDRPALLVAIDTSGSMANTTLVQIAHEVARLAPRADMTVVECDAGIQRVYPFTGEIREVRGRGGTDLTPVFEPAFLARHRPEGILYFTDGEGPWPREAPAVPTLWVLVGDEPFGCPWGRRVRMVTAD